MIKRVKMSNELYPVEAFFNRLSHEQFMIAIKNFSNGKGYNPEDMTCFFPSDIVEDEGGEIKDYKYIEFWEYAGNQEVRLNFRDFISALTEASDSEIKLNPSVSDEIEELISKAKDYLVVLYGQ